MLKKLLAFLFIFGLSSLTLAQEIVVVGDQFDRLYEVDGNGNASGLSVDILSAMSKKTGDTFAYHFYPWPRALALVEHGKADVIAGIYKSPEREAHFLFGDYPYYQDQIKLYALADRSFSWNGDLMSLKDKRIGVVRSWYHGAKFEKVQENLRLSTSDNLANGIRLLKQGFIDLLLANDLVMQHYLLTDNTGPAIVAIEPAVDIELGYFAFRKDKVGAELRDKYNDALKEMIENGALAKLAHARKLQAPITTQPK